MVTISRALTVAVIVVGVAALVSITYSLILAGQNSYNNDIHVSFSKSPATYDYSCGTNDYQIYFVLKNLGTKVVTGLSISITSPLCVGSVPSLPTTLDASSSLSFEAETTSENGTLTISGNNTYVLINF
jgi:hypothetical protein